MKKVLLLLSIAMLISTVAVGSTTAISEKLLTIQSDSEPDSLDPQLATDSRAHEFLGTFLEGLCAIDAAGNVVGALAESYEASDDGLTYTFHLRDAKWSNGTPVTAHDFVFAWRRSVSPEVAGEYAFMVYEVAQIKNSTAISKGKMGIEELGVKAVDDKTLVVELESPVIFFDSLTAFPTFFPVNEEFFNSCKGAFATSPETLLSCGPFKVTEFAPATASYGCRKNDKYWDADKVKIGGINYQVIGDTQSSLLNFDSGNMDVIRVGGEQVEMVKESPNFAVLPFAGYLWYLSFNTADNKALENFNFRSAIYYAVDRNLLANHVLADGSDPATYAVPTNLANGPDGKDYRSTGPKYESSDDAKAAKAYKKACAELGTDQFKFELVVDDNDTCANVAVFIQEQLQSKLPGVSLSIRTVTRKQRTRDMRAGKFDIGLARWGADYLDPMTFLALWKTGASNNFGRWSNAEYDQLLEDSTTGKYASDAAGRWAALHRAEELLMKAKQISPLYETHSCVLMNQRMKGLSFHPYGILRNYKHVTISD